MMQHVFFFSLAQVSLHKRRYAENTQRTWQSKKIKIHILLLSDSWYLNFGGVFNKDDPWCQYLSELGMVFQSTTTGSSVIT